MESNHQTRALQTFPTVWVSAPIRETDSKVSPCFSFAPAFRVKGWSGVTVEANENIGSLKHSFIAWLSTRTDT